MQAPSIKSSRPLVAFFGATGACSAAALIRALNAGYFCTARTIGHHSLRIAEIPADAHLTVARTPSKLTELLLSKGVSQSIISSHLNVTQGDVRDVGAVKSALSPNGQTASLIISGIGIYTLGPVTACAEATTSILSALADLKQVQNPLLVVISTTGFTAGPRDVPLLQVPLYKLAPHKAHKDIYVGMINV